MAEYNHQTGLSYHVALGFLITNPNKKLWRAGWNGKNIWITMVRQTAPVLLPGFVEAVSVQPYIAMYTTDGTLVPWLCSQTDALATDWEIIDEKYFEIDRRNGVSVGDRPFA